MTIENKNTGESLTPKGFAQWFLYKGLTDMTAAYAEHCDISEADDNTWLEAWLSDNFSIELADMTSKQQETVFKHMENLVERLRVILKQETT